MCNGETGTMYCGHWDGKFVVLELDCSRLPFTHTGKTIQSGMENIYDMCYSSHPQPGMLIFTAPPYNKIRAVSVDTGTNLWELTKSQIDGLVIYPHGITVSTVNNYVFVCDGTNNRLLVLRSRDGKVINTHHVDNCGVAAVPYLINNQQQLVLWYRYQKKESIALFQVK